MNKRNLIGRLSNRISRTTLDLYCSVIPTKKTISAVLRVRNEGLFLRAAVESILPSVDEVIIVDNQSSDQTLAVANSLQSEFAQKVRVFTYHHDIAKCGEDNKNEFAKDPKSPRLLSNFYNFSFGKAKMNYLLKWDGDMIATPAFHEVVREFRKTIRQTVFMKGFDVSRTARKIDSEGSRSFESRLFRRQGSEYRTGPVCEYLHSPFLFSNFSCPDDCFIHLKFLKEDPYSNHTQALAELRHSQLNETEELVAQDDLAILRSYGIVVAQPHLH
jgi:hypothetical protein